MTVTQEDLHTAIGIAKRVMEPGGLGERNPGLGLDEKGIVADLIMVHAGCCPLRLHDMLEASDFDLMHDVLGIHDKLDRDAVKFTDEFWQPRFAV